MYLFASGVPFINLLGFLDLVVLVYFLYFLPTLTLGLATDLYLLPGLVLADLALLNFLLAFLPALLAFLPAFLAILPIDLIPFDFASCSNL